MPLLDDYLQFVAARARPNTVLATAYDLKVFFTVVGKPVRRVRAADVMAFITAQRTGGEEIGPHLVEEVVGLSARTVRRRLSSVSGLYAYLQARGDVTANPVPRGLPTRRQRRRPHQGVPLIPTPRTLPRVLAPAEVDALLAALRTQRDRAMVTAMVLGGLRRCEVLGLRFPDCGSASGGCSSWRGRAVISGWCRSPAGSSVADEYFAVTEKVEALYRTGAALPADAAGPKMTRLRREHHRMLGNGYCTRPPSSTAPSSRSARPAPTSRPASSSGPPCNTSTTTPRARARPAASSCSPDS